MNAQKLVVGCVAVAALAAFVLVPYMVDESAGDVCVAVAAIGALWAFSAKLGTVVDSAEKSTERLIHQVRNSGLGLVLALLWLWKGHSVVAAFGELRFAFYMFWPLATGWLSYKTVRALLRQPSLA